MSDAYHVHQLNEDTYLIEEKTLISQGFVICFVGRNERF